MSEERLNRARIAVDHFAGGDAEGSPEPWIQDLITDLLHLIEDEGGDVEEVIRLSFMHWNEERRYVRC